MKIINQTKYDTAALRKLITATHARLAKHEGRAATWTSLKITAVYSRRGWPSGWATLSGSRMRLRLPAPKYGRIEASIFAWLVEHELFHTHGYEHRHMAKSNHGATSAETHAWATALFPDGLPLQQPKVKARPSQAALQEQRHQHVLALMKTWTTKLKRAQTALAKLRQRSRYYERALAAHHAEPTRGEPDGNHPREE